MPKAAREIPWLDRGADGLYAVLSYDKAARRVRRHGLRTRDAVAAQAAYIAYLTEGGATSAARPSPALGITVDQALDDYWREHARDTLADPQRQQDAIAHLKAYFGGLMLGAIDIPACRGYARARREGVIGGGKRRTGDRKRATGSTIRRELGVLKAAANHAARWKRIGQATTPPTPMPTFEMPADSASGEEAAWLTKADVALLLANATGVLRDFIHLAYWWGARRGWIEALEARQVNFETGRVNPYKPGQKLTKKRRQIMPIYDDIRPTLQRLVKEAQDGWLFGMTADFYRPFRELCEGLGLDDRANPHVLRHSRATHMLMDGESIYKVARLLGDTVKTVESVYGHHSPEYLAERNGGVQ